MSFLGVPKKFLNVQDQQEQPTQAPVPPPIAPAKFGAPSPMVAKSSTAAVKPAPNQQQYQEVNQPAGPTGPVVGAPQPAPAPAPAPQPATAPAPTQVQKTEAIGVTGERGAWTTDKDAASGIVYDADANNKTEASIAKTFVGGDGRVHYTNKNPDGSPKAPWEDKDGWSKLNDEQKKSAAVDFQTALENHNTEAGKNADGSSSYMDPEEWSKLDDAGKLAATKDFVSGGKSTVTNADGSSTVTDREGTTTATDADGNVTVVKKDGSTTVTNADGSTSFTTADGSKKEVAADGTTTVTSANGKRTVTTADGTKTTTAADGATTVFKPDGTKQVTAADGSVTTTDAQGNVSTQAPPQKNPDGTITYPDKGGATVTKDTSGRVTARTLIDGTQVAYGTGKAMTEERPDGTIRTTDSNGKVTISTKDGSPAREAQQQKEDVGFNADGSKISTFELYAKAKGFDPEKATPRERADFERKMSASNESNWSKGEEYARAAMTAGLLSFEQYTQLRESDFAHSFGAWLASNGDIMRAIDNSNIPVKPDGSLKPQAHQQQGKKFDPEADAYFSQLRGDQKYVELGALTGQDFYNANTGAVEDQYRALNENRVGVYASEQALRDFGSSWDTSSLTPEQLALIEQQYAIIQQQYGADPNLPLAPYEQTFNVPPIVNAM
jgi:hypothetical protein